MLKFNPSVSGLSVLMALALGLWEWYFFFYGGRWEGPFGWFTPNRLGFNLAWLALRTRATITATILVSVE
jgi:hypothetical protein